MAWYKRALVFGVVWVASALVSAMIWIDSAGDGRMRTGHFLLSVVVVIGIIVLQFTVSRDRAQLAGLLKIARRDQERYRTTDSLTGLYNRQYFHDRLSDEGEKCLMSGKPLALILVDVDDFTAVNDKYGIPVGDVVLTEISHRLKTVARTKDILARHGGEEFIMFLPGIEEDGAVAVAERLRQTVSENSILALGSIRIPMTVSVGVAAATGRSEITPEDLILRAERALLRAKEFGRDRVVCARLPIPQYTNHSKSKHTDRS